MSNMAIEITDSDVASFQQLYKTRLGLTIDKDEAIRKLHMLLRQMELVYSPITKSQASLVKNEYGNEHNEKSNTQRTQL